MSNSIRLKTICGGRVTPENIGKLAAEQIKSAGTSNSKVRCIQGLTEAVLCGDLDFDKFPSMTDEDVMQELMRLHGIGHWTAKMYLLFALDRPDVLPYEDVAFLQVYRWAYKTDDCSKEAVCKKCKKWKPYSSVDARFFYAALDMGLTKEEFHLFKQKP